MMHSIPEVVTPRFKPSRLLDGTEVWTAWVDEIPGISLDAPTMELAAKELEAALRDIRKRLELPKLGIAPPTVGWWRWTLVTSPGATPQPWGMDESHRPQRETQYERLVGA